MDETTAEIANPSQEEIVSILPTIVMALGIGVFVSLEGDFFIYFVKNYF